MDIYKCEYCGKLFERYASARKKSKGCFCSTECAYRARYSELDVSEEDFNFYYKKHIGMLKKLSSRYKPQYFNEMMQVSRITLWKVIDKKNKGMIKGVFSTYLYKAIKDQLSLYWHKEIKNKIYNIYENEMMEDSEILYHFNAKDEEIDVKLDSFSKLNVILNEFPKMCVACRLVVEKELLNKNDNFLMKKYAMDKRKLVYNISSGKRQLRNNFKIKYGWCVG